MQTKRLSKSFEGLNSSLVQSTGELWSCIDLTNMGKLCPLGKLGQLQNCKTGEHPGGPFGCHDRPLCTAGAQH